MNIVQKGTMLKISFPEKENQVFDIKLSPRVFRKFTKNVLDWVKKLLEVSSEFKTYYTELMYLFLTTRDVRLVVNEEFINRCSTIANSYVNDKVVIDVKEGVLTREQLNTLYQSSFTLKLVAPFLYTTILLEEERLVLFKRLTEPLKESGVEDFLFEFVRLKFLARANTSLWSWIANNRFQDINYHVLNTYNTVLTQILLQLLPGFNPIAYIKTVVEYSIYYLLTDVYVDEVRYTEGELKKIRYTYNYSLIQKHIVKQAVNRLNEYVKDRAGVFRIVDNHQHLLNVRPITNFITLPFLSKLLDVSYLYLQNVKQPQYLNIYTAFFLESFATNLVLLRQVTKSFVTPYNIKYRGSTFQEYTSSLYNLEHPLRKVFKETQVFDNVLKSLLSYNYWDLGSRQQITLSPTRLARELNLFFTFLLSDKWSIVFEYLRSNNFDLQSGMLIWKV